MKREEKKPFVFTVSFLVVSFLIATFSFRSNLYQAPWGEPLFYQTVFPPFWVMGCLAAALLLMTRGIKEQFSKSLRSLLIFLVFLTMWIILVPHQRVLGHLSAVPQVPLFAVAPLIVERVAPYAPSFGYGMEFLTGLFGVLALRSIWWLIVEKGWKDVHFVPTQLLYLLLPIASGYVEAVLFRGRVAPIAFDENGITFIGWLCMSFFLVILLLPVYFLTVRAVPLSRRAAITIGSVTLALVLRAAWLPFLHISQPLADYNYLLYAIVFGAGWPDGLLFSLPLCLAIKALWARRRPRQITAQNVE